MTDHRTGTREEWQAARDELLRLEKEHTRMGDDLARMRRELPWVPVEKEYRFDTGDGTRTLAELFDGHSQLLIYHFMFGPSYTAGCPTCSSSADAVNAVLPHLHARDVTMLYVSRAPIERLLAYKERMGWSFPWVSCATNDFNFDMGFSYTDEQVNEFAGPLLEASDPPILDANAAASGTDVAGYLTEGPGISSFAMDDDVAYHTYSTQARGLEFLMAYYPILDRAPKGATKMTGCSSGSSATTSTREVHRPFGLLSPVDDAVDWTVSEDRRMTRDGWMRTLAAARRSDAVHVSRQRVRDRLRHRRDDRRCPLPRDACAPLVRPRSTTRTSSTASPSPTWWTTRPMSTRSSPRFRPCRVRFSGGRAGVVPGARPRPRGRGRLPPSVSRRAGSDPDGPAAGAHTRRPQHRQGGIDAGSHARLAQRARRTASGLRRSPRGC